MTLEEGIIHAENEMRKNNREADRCFRHGGYAYEERAKSCRQCAEEHRQLAEWLKELKWWKSLPHYCLTCKYGEMGKHFSECKSCSENNNWTCGYEGGETE